MRRGVASSNALKDSFDKSMNGSTPSKPGKSLIRSSSRSIHALTLLGFLHHVSGDEAVGYLIVRNQRIIE